MADIALTAAQIAPVFNTDADIIRAKAKVALTAGQVVYINTTTLDADLAKADAIGTAVVAGVVLNPAGIGGVVDLLIRGQCYGFTVSGLTVGSIAYLSAAAAGALADTKVTGTNVVVPVGRIHVLPDGTKVLFVNIDQNQNYVAIGGSTVAGNWPT